MHNICSRVIIEFLKYVLLFQIFSTVLLQPNGDDKWTLPDRKSGKYNVNLVLPAGVTCAQCILQVIQTTRNTILYNILIFLHSYCNNMLLYNNSGKFPYTRNI